MRGNDERAPRRVFETVAAGLAVVVFTCTLEARAAEFYDGKTITLSIGFGAGGGYDLYGRLAARWLAKHIPGTPLIVVQNRPGGGGMNVANFLSKAAAKDGTQLGIASDGAALNQLLEESGVEFDMTRFNWIGRLASATSIWFAWHTAPVKTFADVRARETIVGTSGAGVTSDFPRAMNALAGARFKLIAGYRGSADVLLAIERGEIEVAYALLSDLVTRKQEWLREGKIAPLFIARIGRDPALPDVPNAEELVADAEARAALRLLASSTTIGRAIFTTPEAPPDRVAVLRAGFMAMLADPGFLEDTAKSGLPLDPLNGEATQRLVRGSILAPANVIGRAKAARK